MVRWIFKELGQNAPDSAIIRSMPRNIKQLEPLYSDQNQRTLKRLRRVMGAYDLKQAEVARLLGVSKTTVTYWFQDRLRCPDNAPELLRSMCETISPEYLKRLKHGAP